MKWLISSLYSVRADERRAQQRKNRDSIKRCKSEIGLGFAFEVDRSCIVGHVSNYDGLIASSSYTAERGYQGRIMSGRVFQEGTEPWRLFVLVFWPIRLGRGSGPGTAQS
jgi:hypothetical protein